MLHAKMDPRELEAGPPKDAPLKDKALHYFADRLAELGHGVYTNEDAGAALVARMMVRAWEGDSSAMRQAMSVLLPKEQTFAGTRDLGIDSLPPREKLSATVGAACAERIPLETAERLSALVKREIDADLDAELSRWKEFAELVAAGDASPASIRDAARKALETRTTGDNPDEAGSSLKPGRGSSVGSGASGAAVKGGVKSNSKLPPSPRRATPTTSSVVPLNAPRKDKD